MCLFFLVASHALCQSAQSAAPSASDQPQLRFVAIVTRHGVRSPTGKLESLNLYSAQPWPRWSVPAGYLTARGFDLIKFMGSYDRAWLNANGLLRADGCQDAQRVRIIADSDQRTRETGKALAEGLLPGCEIPVKALPEGSPDPLFHLPETAASNAQRELAAGALMGRVGGDAAHSIDAFRPQLQQLQQILDTCPAAAACNPAPPQSLVALPAVIAPGKSDHLVEFRSALGLASTMTENFLLEYCQGMDAAQVGWGKVDLPTLRALLQLHVAQEDLAGRTEAIARPQASSLLYYLVQSIDQAATGKPIPAALTAPQDRLLILSAHDTNLVNIAGALHLNWIVDGRKDDTPPGGALIFELWQRGTGDHYEVRTSYVAQTLEQMRNLTPLSLANPPQRVPVFLPGCSRADAACDLRSFRRALEQAIDPAFVIPLAPYQ